jgi:hypothetical protein
VGKDYRHEKHEGADHPDDDQIAPRRLIGRVSVPDSLAIAEAVDRDAALNHVRDDIEFGQSLDEGAAGVLDGREI